MPKGFPARNQKNSTNSINSVPLGQISVSQSFNFRAMNYRGPLPETSQTNKRILAVVDYFPQWCEEFATPDRKASSVVPFKVSMIFCWFGSPAVLHSDQGQYFERTQLHEVFILWVQQRRALLVTILIVIERHRAGRPHNQAMLSSFVSNRRND